MEGQAHGLQSALCKMSFLGKVSCRRMKITRSTPCQQPKDHAITTTLREYHQVIPLNWFGLLGPFQTMVVCPEIKQKQPQDGITIFETLSLPVAKILSPVARQAPTKPKLSEETCLLERFLEASDRVSLMFLWGSTGFGVLLGICVC